MNTLEGLKKQARDAVDAVADNPQARLEMRRGFYQKYPGPSRIGPGLGASELAFMGWEIERGVLEPLSRGGSPWWRAVNTRLIYNAELASLIRQHGVAEAIGSTAATAWLDYIDNPSPMSWYRAHNRSIVDGYLDAADLAHAEPWSERVFVNVVLYRLLYAQGLVEGVDLGELGKILSDPADPSVDVLVHIPAFYPRHYPLSRHEVKDLLQRGHSCSDELAAGFDDLFVIPQLQALYDNAEQWLGQPGLAELIDNGRPCYPADLAPVSSSDPRPERPPAPGPKRRIAILGGGLASLAAAYELTSYDGWQDRYEVTLYQIGWRVGGKTSNGFGPGDRIEERGIHIFQGWYANAFRMVRDAYHYMEEHALAPDSPLQKWNQAFVPDDATLFTEFDADAGRWTNWPVLFPYNDKLPGEAGPPPIGEILGEAVGLLAELLLGSPYEQQQGCLSALVSDWVIDRFFTPPWEKSAPDWWKHLKAATEERRDASPRRELRWLEHAKVLLNDMMTDASVRLGPFEISALRAATFLFSGVVELLRLIGPDDLAKNSRLAHIVVLAEYGLANLRGILNDVYDEGSHSFDFHRINKYDYREWLLSHGLPAKLRDSAPVRFIYCGCFHNRYYEVQGQLAADMGVRSLMASVTYRGSLVWKLVAGTGGSLTAPLYKMLSHRGVRFEFFRDVQEIHWSPGDQIDAMTVGVQVDLGAGRDTYEPLKKVKHVDGWPSHPHFSQLDESQADQLKRGKIDLESPWADWRVVRTEVLRRGIHFDDIILGIPIGATKTICAKIVERKQAWKDMVEYVRTTPTLGVQIWLRPTLEDMGMPLSEWGMSPSDEPNSVIYADLLYSWTDMSLVMPFEGWTADDTPGELSYYCGTWPAEHPAPPFSDHTYPARERKRLIETTGTWLGENMGWFWPKAVSGKQFDFALLVVPTDPENAQAHSATERLESQWFVANIEPTNHYTLAWPNSDQYRLKADQSGFKNLYLCGDWTNFGLNIGHVEGAVTSGLLAAQCTLKALGQTKLREIFPDVAAPGAG